jgi:hypothetical protein
VQSYSDRDGSHKSKKTEMSTDLNLCLVIYMNKVSVAFIRAMLTVELIQLSFRSIDFTCVSVRHKTNINNTENRLISVPHLSRNELLAVGTERLVVNGQIHAIINIANFPNVFIALVDDLELNVRQVISALTTARTYTASLGDIFVVAPLC